MKDKSDFTLIELLKHLVFMTNIGKYWKIGGIKMGHIQKTNQQTHLLKDGVLWNKEKPIPSMQFTLKFWEVDKNE